MSRPVNNQPIHTISGRRGLAPKAAPYWRSVYPGLRVGWQRRPRDASGRWFARLALPGNDIREAVFGAADDPPAKADGSAVLNYGQAVVAAQAWAAALKVNPDASTRPRGRRRHRASLLAGPTVEDAMLAYIEAKRLRGQVERAGEAETVLHRHMAQPFRRLPVAELTPELLNTWLAQLPGSACPGGGLSQGRIDKIRGVLRAALHQANTPEAVIRQGLSAAAMPRRSAPATRETIPTPDEVQRLIAAMRAIDEDLALFMETLAITGTRPSQLARCRREDLDILNGLLTIPPSAKGRAGAQKVGRGVSFPIGTELAGRVANQLHGDSGLLFHTAKMEPDFSLIDRQRLSSGVISGSIWREVGRIAWKGGLWARKVRDAVHAAGLDPEITLYSLRHARIIRLIQAGMALREIAALTDTSASMIERAYARHIAATDATTARLRKILEAEKPLESPPVLHVVA